MVYFVIGFVIEEQALGGEKVISGRDAEQILAGFPLAAIATREITLANAAQRFAFGLDLQIRALRTVISEKLMTDSQK